MESEIMSYVQSIAFLRHLFPLCVCVTQLSTSVSRLLVQESVMEEMATKLRIRLKKLIVAQSLERNCDVAAMTSKAQKERMCEMVENARLEGAEVRLSFV